MTTEIVTTKPKSALVLMAERCQVDPAKLHETLKNTVFKGATDDEMLALVVTANTYELNPLLKELYAFPKKGGGITPMVGVDGWLKIANRQPNFDGMEVEVYGDGKTPTHATCEIFLKDRSRPIKITEYFEECKRNTDPWSQMPRRMLRNKAIIQCVRVAFGIGGIHDEDEARDISEPRNVTPPQSRLRTAQIEPFAQPEPIPEPPPEPDVPANPAKAEPQGRQKKPRYQRDGRFWQLKALQSDEGKAFWKVTVRIASKDVEFVTFSETLAAAFQELEFKTPIRITVVETAQAGTFQIEDFEVIETAEEGLV
jgi:phage recombination protein Bet